VRFPVEARDVITFHINWEEPVEAEALAAGVNGGHPQNWGVELNLIVEIIASRNPSIIRKKK